MKKLTIMLGLLANVLLSGAQNAIVLKDDIVVEVDNSGDGYTVSRSYTYRVLNDRAGEMLNYVGYFSKNNELTSFSGNLVTDDGFTRKIKKSDLLMSEYSRNLADDSYMYLFHISPPSYPATITYTIKEVYNKEMIALPPLAPQCDYGVEVKNAKYKIIYPAGFSFNTYAANTDVKPVESVDKSGKKVVTYEMSDIKAIEKEPYCRYFTERVPIIRFSPVKFLYADKRGSLKTWQDMGMWSYDLGKFRDQLPPDATAKIHEVADTCNDAKGKVAALYKLLGEHTHYVSIQLGIGGYQPMNAADCWKLCYGDCKGLSNLMKAMLKEVGIKSHMVAIGTTHKSLYRQFPSFQQMDHMILEVPLEKDTCWLECTNTAYPVGYVHEDIAGHDALELTENGGRIVTLPEYADTLNRNVTKVDVTLEANGAAVVDVVDDYSNRQYEDVMGIDKLDHKELVTTTNGMYGIPEVTVKDVKVENNAVPFRTPHMVIKYKADSRKYANVTGNRLFIKPAHIFGRYRTPLFGEGRTEDLLVRYGYADEKVITINIPEGYEVEAMPAPSVVTKPFGKIVFVAMKVDDKIILGEQIEMKKGSYPVSMAGEMREFFKKCNVAASVKVVLRKRTQ